MALDSLGGIFPVLESPPSLLELLDEVLGEALLLQLPVEVLDVHRRELVVADDVGEGGLQHVELEATHDGCKQIFFHILCVLKRA